MSVLSISRRYAKSLFDLAQETKKMDKIVADAQLISSAMESRDLVLLCQSPIIKADKKQAAFKAIFDGKVDELTSRFLNLITSKGRESLIPNIMTSVVDLYNESQNIVSAKLTTAVKADSKTIKAINDQIESEGKNVDIKTEIDPDIIGGYILEIGDTVLDASVRRKISDLRKELTNG